MTDLTNIDKQYVANTYNRFPVEISSGKGSIVYDTNGKRYIDMGTGIAVNSFGVSDDEWIKAVTAQLNKVQHTSNLYYTEPCAALAKMLCERTGMKKVFFGNSGAEANECVIKVARKYAAEKKGAEYSTIVTLKNSFHGRTLTTLAATGQEHYHELFRPLTPGFVHVAAGDMDELKKIYRIIDKELPNSSKEVLLVLDATTGQNAVYQAQQFKETADITGIILTKLDGTAKGGIVFAVKNEYDIPVKLIGLGEKAEDIDEFNAVEFVNAIIEPEYE